MAGRDSERWDGGGSADVQPTLDPNYDGGYWGMRMQGGRGRAPYGQLRALRADDLETEGGFGGIHGPRRVDSLAPRSPEGGGMRDPFRDPEFLRDFNSRGVRYGDDRALGPGSRGDGQEVARADDPGVPRRTYDGRYTNRGLSEAGYSEGWARGPMRGAR